MMLGSIKMTGTRGKLTFRLQQRDVEIVEAVHRLRVLRTDQIASLFFPTDDGEISSSCRSRLRHLHTGGYLARLEQPQSRSDGRRPFLFMLTATGLDLLIEELGYEPEDIDWKPSYNNVNWPFLAHQLAINDAYLAVTLAAREIGWQIERWVDDRFLRKQHVDRVPLADDGGQVREVAVVPDAYFVLQRVPPPPQLHFFVEVDRATMSVAPSSARVKSWSDRVRAYQAYFTAQGIIDRYGTRQIRVLTITTGVRRMEALKTATEEVGGQKRYWFTTVDALTPRGALREPIWHVASEGGSHMLVTQP